MPTISKGKDICDSPHGEYFYPNDKKQFVHTKKKYIQWSESSPIYSQAHKYLDSDAFHNSDSAQHKRFEMK